MMLVYVAHSGKTVQLEVQPGTRVDAVQQALAASTGVASDQQIIMCEGRRLDSKSTLAAYKLPVEPHQQPRDVFLYCRAHLRPGAAPPAHEELQPVRIEVPEPSTIGYDDQLLRLSPSPLYRASVDYERTFRHHVSEAEAYAAAAKERNADVERLIAEQRVQQVAIEAAVVNVEGHYRFIRDLYSDFTGRYAAQARAQQEALDRFNDDLEALSCSALHPAVQAGTDFKTLSDLLPEQRLRTWADYCRKTHVQFGDKVRELDRIYQGLRADVEALLMQAPLAHARLDKAAADHAARGGQLDEQAAILGALRSDFRTVQHKVEDWARGVAAGAAAAAGGGSPGLMAAGGPGPAAAGSGVDLEELRGMEEMNCVHRGDMLPRVRSAYSAVEELAQQCARDKNAMTAHVFEQLQRISSQQSKIRDMRNKLSAFNEVASKQADAFAQLGVVRQVPAAYRRCMAECVRRQAFLELFRGQAGALAERMGRLRDREVARREAFSRSVERLAPPALLSAMGLMGAPPHCEVGVPPSDQELLQVTVDELRRLGGSPLEAMAAQAAEADERVDVDDEATSPSGEGGGSSGDGGYSSSHAMRLENAKLRAELAQLLATQDAASTTAAGRPSHHHQQQQRSFGGGSMHASQLGSSPGAGAAAHVGGGQQSSVSASPSVAASQHLTLGGSVLAAMGGGGSSPGPGPHHGTAADALAAVAANSGGLGGGGVWQEALAAKDAYVRELSQQLADARRRAVSYERRVGELEALAASGARSAHSAQQTEQGGQQASMPSAPTAAPCGTAAGCSPSGSSCDTGALPTDGGSPIGGVAAAPAGVAADPVQPALPSASSAETTTAAVTLHVDPLGASQLLGGTSAMTASQLLAPAGAPPPRPLPSQQSQDSSGGNGGGTEHVAAEEAACGGGEGGGTAEETTCGGGGAFAAQEHESDSDAREEGEGEREEGKREVMQPLEDSSPAPAPGQGVVVREEGMGEEGRPSEDSSPAPAPGQGEIEQQQQQGQEATALAEDEAPAVGHGGGEQGEQRPAEEEEEEIDPPAAALTRQQPGGNDGAPAEQHQPGGDDNAAAEQQQPEGDNAAPAEQQQLEDDNAPPVERQQQAPPASPPRAGDRIPSSRVPRSDPGGGAASSPQLHRSPARPIKGSSAGGDGGGPASSSSRRARSPPSAASPDSGRGGHGGGGGRSRAGGGGSDDVSALVAGAFAAAKFGW